MIYGKVEPSDIYEVEALLHVQEAHMEKYNKKKSLHLVLQPIWLMRDQINS